VDILSFCERIDVCLVENQIVERFLVQIQATSAIRKQIADIPRVTEPLLHAVALDTTPIKRTTAVVQVIKSYL
jgi:hypothetical protein